MITVNEMNKETNEFEKASEEIRAISLGLIGDDVSLNADKTVVRRKPKLITL